MAPIVTAYRRYHRRCHAVRLRHGDRHSQKRRGQRLLASPGGGELARHRDEQYLFRHARQRGCHATIRRRLRQQAGDGAIDRAVSNQISSGRTCTGGPGGNVRLDVTGTGPFTATFVRLTAPATPIGSFQFRKDTPQINAYAGATLEEILNLGGAGFSLCSLGVVLDADARSYAQRVLALTLIDLQTGTKGTPYGFGYYSPAVQNGNTYYYTRSAPTIFRSPDGTIILVEHPSITTAFRVAVGVIDAVKLGQAGQLISTVETSATQVGFTSGQVNANNQIVLTVSGTTYPAITIR